MIAMVREIYDKSDPLRNPFRSRDKVPLLRAELQDAPVEKQLGLKMQIALCLLQAGQIDEALAEYDDIDRRLQLLNWEPEPALQIELMTGRAMCHLRRGEVANCLLNHNGDSCIFPIKGGGVHVKPEGSRAAVEVLTNLLEKYPRDLRARWLLNIAYMTLGEYPDSVPPKLLIDPKRFESDYDITRFHDVAGNVGLAINELAGGVVMEDFDHDGYLDLMISAWGFEARDQLRVFRSNGDGTFTERTDQAGLTGIVGGLNLRQGDYNNDGFADVLVLRGAWLDKEGNYPFSLLRNNGDFTFTDVTEEAGVLRFKPSQTAVWFDFNGDGWLDIFVANESAGDNVKPCDLFRNNGDGTFTEVAAACGLDLVGFFKGVAVGDFNRDGRPDLLLSDRAGPKRLLRNDGPASHDRSTTGAWVFTDVAEEAGIDGPDFSFPCWFWDYDNDGWDDILISGYGLRDVGDVAADYMGRPTSASRARLYRNNGDGTFTNVSREAGVSKVLHTMGAGFGDLDNDGWLDFYLGTGDPDFSTLMPNRMFRNDGGKRFQDVTTSGGFGQLQKGHGIAFGDLDNDGDQDIYSVVGGAVESDNYPNQLFENPGHGNNWLKLMLEGTRTNRVAIGARVKVVALENGAERAIHRTVTAGASFGNNPLRQEIGLGKATVIDRVEVFWPVTGKTQIFRQLSPNQTYRLVEGKPEAEIVNLKSFSLPKTPSADASHHHHH
ncbi:MAG: CRTAC1 family protein [Opitutus sp.]|nr:CRTAC1 family protein [Opitutus sp.]